MARVRAWWLRKLNGSDLSLHRVRRRASGGCPELFRRITGAARLVWRMRERARTPITGLLADVERNAPAMREDLSDSEIRACDALPAAPSSEQEGGRGATDRGFGMSFYLELHNMDFEAHRERCPVTCGRVGAYSSDTRTCVF